MRIGIDADPANVVDGAGVEMYVNRLLAALGRVDRENRYNLYLRQAARPHFPQLPDNFRHRVIPAPVFWHQIRMPLALAADANDVVFFPVHRIPVTPVRGRIVGTIHDTAFLHHPKSYPPLHRRHLMASTWIMTRRATLLIAISRHTADHVERDYDVPASRIRIVHSAWDRDLARPRPPAVRDAVRERFGIPPRYFLSVAALRPGKNLEQLVAAYSRLLRRPSVDAANVPDLVLAGKEDWPYGAIPAAIRRHGVGERVHLTGFLPREELIALLQGAFALVFPSLHEGFGLPALEGMGAGVPVLVSGEGSLPEVAGDDALRFDARDADSIAARMEELLADPRLRQRLIDGGRVRADRFSWDDTARATLDVLREAAVS